MGDLAGVALFGGKSSRTFLLDMSSWALSGLRAGYTRITA